MLARLVAALILLALALCAVWAAENWGDDRHPLAIDASGCSPPVRLPNPCATMNCNRRPTREIA
jgi:hypothetical protein